MPDDPPIPDACTCSAVRKAARHITQHYDRHLAPTGLRTSQFSILAQLARLGPRTINELAAHLAMDRTTMGRNVRPLERAGLLAIRVDPRDGRRRALSLTETGLARVAEARTRWLAAQASFEAAYGADPALALRKTLAGVVAVDLSRMPTP